MAEQINVLFGKKRGGIVGTLQLDATITETHTINNQVTEFPIEDGANISDHIRQLPDEITMSCFVTNTPVDIRQQSNAQVVTDAAGNTDIRNIERSIVSNRVVSALEQLLTMSGRRLEGSNIDPQLVTVVTGLRVYRNMGIVTMTIPRNAVTGSTLRFDISLKQITKVTSETIELPDAKDKDTTSSTNKKSSIVTKETTDKQELRTSAVKGLWNRAATAAARKK